MQGEKKNETKRFLTLGNQKNKQKNSVLKKVENQQLEYHIQVTYQEMWKTVQLP